MKSVKEKKKELLIKSAILLGISVLLLIVAIYLGNIMHSDDTFVETYFFPQAGEGSAFFFWNSMIFLVISFVTFINIEDNGQGVEDKYLEKLSEPFFKIDKSRNIEKSGIGLGLAISKEIILANNGIINFSKSKKYKGLNVEMSFDMIFKN
jgi:hypothetical protein